MRPTPEEIQKARERFDYLSFDKASVRELEAKLDSILGKGATKHIRVLLAATVPPSDEEIAELAVQRFCDPDDRDSDYPKQALWGVQDATPYGSVYAFSACFSMGIRSLLGPVKP